MSVLPTDFEVGIFLFDALVSIVCFYMGRTAKFWYYYISVGLCYVFRIWSFS